MKVMRILVIEDDVEAANYLVKAFREEGHVADHAADGLDGYAAAPDTIDSRDEHAVGNGMRTLDRLPGVVLRLAMLFFLARYAAIAVG